MPLNIRHSKFGFHSGDENVFDKLFGDDSVGSRGLLFRGSVQPFIDGVQLPTQITSDIEPPVADEDRLGKLRSIRAEKRGLTTVDIAVMPSLAASLLVGEEAGKRLVVAVKVRVRHCRQDWIVGARFSCIKNKQSLNQRCSC